MAGDWMKIETALPDKPEVWGMAEELGLEPDSVTGKLIRVWGWFDENTEDGNAPSVTKKIIDRYAGVAGFVTAMSNVGWLVEHDGVISIPNYDRHNGNSAKKRALTAKRQQKYRNASVTHKASPEKRREEKSTSKGKTQFIPPSVDDVAAYCAERSNGINPEQFIDHYESNGWMRGKSKIKDWKACVRTWEQSRKDKTASDLYAEDWV